MHNHIQSNSRKKSTAEAMVGSLKIITKFLYLVLYCYLTSSVHAFYPGTYITSHGHLPFRRAGVKQLIASAVEKSGVSSIQSKTYRLGDSLQLDSSGRRVLLRTETDKVSIELAQQTRGVVPRSYLPLFMNIMERAEGVEENSLFSAIEGMLRWVLDYGGRIAQLQIYAPEQTAKILSVLGIAEKRIDPESSESFFVFSNSRLRQHCRQRLDAKLGDAHALWDIIGRLEHDAGDPKAAIKSYTAALQMDSQISSTFRNLGSAYHATGDMQLAFASYQQAIQLDPKGKAFRNGQLSPLPSEDYSYYLFFFPRRISVSKASILL